MSVAVGRGGSRWVAVGRGGSRWVEVGRVERGSRRAAGFGHPGNSDTAGAADIGVTAFTRD